MADFIVMNAQKHAKSAANKFPGYGLPTGPCTAKFPLARGKDMICGNRRVTQKRVFPEADAQYWYQSMSGKPTVRESVRRRLFDMVDDEIVEGRGDGFQLQAELIFYCFE